MTRIWIKNHARKFTQKHKIYQSNEKLTPIIFINFQHVKISQKQSQTHQEHVVIFWNFCKKLKCTGGPNSRNEGEHSKNQEKLERNQKNPALPGPNPRRLMDPDLQNASEALD